MTKKTGPKLKEGVPANVATMLRIDRALYAELSKIAIFENITITQALNEAVQLRITQFVKESRKRKKESKLRREAEWDSAPIINGRKYEEDVCRICFKKKLIQWGDSVCDSCKKNPK